MVFPFVKVCSKNFAYDFHDVDPALYDPSRYSLYQETPRKKDDTTIWFLEVRRLIQLKASLEGQMIGTRSLNEMQREWNEHVGEALIGENQFSYAKRVLRNPKKMQYRGGMDTMVTSSALAITDNVDLKRFKSPTFEYSFYMYHHGYSNEPSIFLMYDYEIGNNQEFYCWSGHRQTIEELRTLLLSQQMKIECELERYSGKGFLSEAMVLWVHGTSGLVARTNGWLQELDDIRWESVKYGNGYI
ncbi:MAG: hypothetical protein Q9184_006191 [Pyrenodesmia sp. 2 TL-2023]